jgi:hypothetical protein
MSDAPANGAGLDLRAELARIDRDRAETVKLLAGAQLRIPAETRKLQAEQANLIAQEAKALREWRLAPWLAWLGVAGGLITISGAILHALGH